jgi:hypothetical protein
VKIVHVQPIVEGQGDVEAVPPLLCRTVDALRLGMKLVVRPPIRVGRSSLIQKNADALRRSLDLAAAKLRQTTSPFDHRMALLLIDADDSLPCELSPRLLERCRDLRADLDVSVVLANPEFETWLVAGSRTLEEDLNLDAVSGIEEAEKRRLGKRWIAERMRDVRYRETVDQARFATAFDPLAARRACPSFDKLCRELERRIG